MGKKHTQLNNSVIGGQALVIAAAGILAGLSTFSLIGAMMAPFGALFGLAWGWALTKVAARLARTPEQHMRAATMVLVLVLVSTSIQLGGGIIYHLLLSTATQMADGPGFILRPEVGNSLNLFFMISNTVSEYALIPLAVLLNWRMPGRRALILAMALTFYADRVLTYLYFAPNIIDMTAHQTANAAQRLTDWTRYDGARLIADVTIPVLALATLAKSFGKKLR